MVICGSGMSVCGHQFTGAFVEANLANQDFVVYGLDTRLPRLH